MSKFEDEKPISFLILLFLILLSAVINYWAVNNHVSGDEGYNWSTNDVVNFYLYSIIIYCIMIYYRKKIAVEIYPAYLEQIAFRYFILAMVDMNESGKYPDKEFIGDLNQIINRFVRTDRMGYGFDDSDIGSFLRIKEGDQGIYEGDAAIYKAVRKISTSKYRNVLNKKTTDSELRAFQNSTFSSRSLYIGIPMMAMTIAYIATIIEGLIVTLI